MKNNIEQLKNKINLGKFPTKHPHFAGANLIITNDPERNYLEGDILVITEHASAFSWLVFQLKDIYNERLNGFIKYGFYSAIGNFMLEASATDDDIFDQMFFIIDSVENEMKKK